MVDKITARIAKLEEELAQYVAQANQRIAAYQGAIAELRRLLEETQADEPTDIQ